VKLLIHGINFSPELTGVGKYTGEMADWLAARGHEVRVVTAPPYYPDWALHPGYRGRWYGAEHRSDKLRVWRCPIYVPKIPSGFRRLLHLSSFCLSSLPIMLRESQWRPDVIWTVEPTVLAAPIALFCGRVSRSFTWLHIQDYELDAAFELGILRGRTARRFATWAERRLMRRFNRVSTISERMHVRALEKGVQPDRLTLLVNWADLEAKSFDSEIEALRALLDIPPRSLVLLYSGTMGKKQGLTVLAQAAARLVDDPGLTFVFCGTGPERPALEASCEGLPHVRFLDLQPSERLPSLLGMASVHLLSQEGSAADLVMPSKLTGILASGVPVIASCKQGTDLAAVADQCGLVVPPGDVEALVSAIERLAQDEVLRLSLGRNARAYAEQHLSMQCVLERFERGLHDLCRALPDD
jgi:colanic acid biosynthesis glycosyl transferase WcaI